MGSLILGRKKTSTKLPGCLETKLSDCLTERNAAIRLLGGLWSGHRDVDFLWLTGGLLLVPFPTDSRDRMRAVESFKFIRRVAATGSIFQNVPLPR